MDDCIVYMVLYKGQWKGGPPETHGGDGVSPYTWVEHNLMFANKLKEELEAEYPDREWYIIEKDVS